MADQTAASLAATLLGLQRKRDPLQIYQDYGKQQMAAGSSTAPLGSGNALEGIARALQGGIGGLVQGYGMAREDQRSKDTVSALGDLYSAKTDAERAAIIKNYTGDSEIIGPIAMQILGQKQQDEQRNKAAAAFGSGYGEAPAAPTPTAPAAGGPANAIAGIESGGRYDAVGPVANAQGNRAYGKYQVLDSNIGPWTQQVLGKPMTPQEFVANPEAQDKVFQAKFGEYTTKYGSPQAAARAWFAGEGGMNNPGAKDVNGVSVAQYQDKFNAGGGAPAGPQIAQGDSLPGGGPPSSVSEPPVIPRPKPSAEQVQKYKALIGSGMDPKDAVGKLDEEIVQQWRADQQRATQVWQDQQQSKRMTEQSAINLGQKAPMEMISKRVDNYETKIRPAALAAVNTIDQLHQVRQVLDSGAFTGTGANAKTFLAKIGEQFGIPSDQAVNTQVLGSVLAKQVLAGSGGTLGTGFSNADRDFMERAQGGQLTLDEPALRRIADIGERQARQTIKNHDAEADRVKRLPGIGQLGNDQFAVPAAPTYQEWSNANPLPQTQGAPIKAATDIVSVQTPDEARKLPSGTKIRLPDGREGVVP